jgi:hypothetical protein
LDHWNHRIVRVGHGENYFVDRVVQLAEACEILVGFPVHVAHRFDDTHCWSEGLVGWPKFAHSAKIIQHAIEGQEVITERSYGKNED